MITTTKITTYKDLINYIRVNNLTVKQSKELIVNSLTLISLQDYKTTEDFLKAVDEYWSKYKNCKGEKPIFLDINLDVRD